jgi:hypothetical protein
VLNGKLGVVVEGEAAVGRVAVLLDGDAKPNALSYENLVAVVGGLATGGGSCTCGFVAGCFGWDWRRGNWHINS